MIQKNFKMSCKQGNINQNYNVHCYMYIIQAFLYRFWENPTFSSFGNVLQIILSCESYWVKNY